MLPAARKGDAFLCQIHGGGAIEGPCCQHVRIGGADAARVGDCGACGSSGTFAAIKVGNPTVSIAGEPAAGMTHATTHAGWIATGSANVYIGNPIVDANGALVPVPPQCAFVWGHRSGGIPIERPRSPIKVVKTGQGSWRFAGVEPLVPVTTYEVIVRGRRIVVLIPSDLSDAGLATTPTIQEIAASLATLSDEQLDSTHEVIVSPHPSPDDDSWKQKYDDPGHVSAALAGGNRVTIHPQYKPGQGWWDALLQHETAHLVWEARPGLPDLWEVARRADRRNVSGYGANNDREDFAEAVRMYSLVKGTPCEAAMRVAFPHRFALLEVVFKKGYPKKAKVTR